MRRIWNIAAAFALLNLIALLVGVGWLFQSGRIDMRRTGEVRALFVETVAERDAREAADQAEIDAQTAVAAQAVSLPGQPPLTAEQQLRVRIFDTSADKQRAERLGREIEDLKATLMRERRLIDDQRAEFEKERGAYDAMREQIAATEGAEQFKKAIATLAEMKPKDAKATLSVLIGQGKEEQVVSYLSALDGMFRASIFTQFIKAGQEQLAADLLEALRTKGIDASPPEEPST